ncbi:MAG: Thermostable carboxypeptidase 1, partial [uncultured Solirubrobacteraceae bacterium]
DRRRSPRIRPAARAHGRALRSAVDRGTARLGSQHDDAPHRGRDAWPPGGDARGDRPRPADPSGGRPAARPAGAVGPGARSGFRPGADGRRRPARLRAGRARPRCAGGRPGARRVGRRAGVARRPRRWGRLRRLPRRARPSPRAASRLRRLLRGPRASLRRPARGLRAGPEGGRSAAAARRAAGGAGAAGGLGRRARRGGVRRPARLLPGRAPAHRDARAAARGRIRRRQLAARSLAASLRLGPVDARRARHHGLRRGRPRRHAVLDPPRVRPWPLRVAGRSRVRAHPARRAGFARPARVPEPSVGERDRPLAAVLRLAAAAPEIGVSRRLRLDRRRRPVSRPQRRAAVGGAHLRRRDDVQPPHRAADGTRDASDRGRAGGRPAAGGVERGYAPAARRRGHRRRPRRAAGHPLGRRVVRLLPDLRRGQPDGRPAVGGAARRPARRRRPARGRRLRAAARVAAREGAPARAQVLAARAAVPGDGGAPAGRPVRDLPRRQAGRRRSGRPERRGGADAGGL